MMAVGWMAFMGALLMDFSKKGIRDKLFIHVQGEKRYLWGFKDSKGEKYFVSQDNFHFANLTQHTESTECVSEEKSFIDKMVSCLCCRDTDIKG